MSTPLPTRPLSILLVEDNPGDVRLTREALLENKVLHELHVVGDGEEALDFLYRRGRHEGAPAADLILLDLNLPRKDGHEVLAEIKGDEDLRRIPVVVLTSSGAETDIARSYGLHANCYVQKPVVFDRFAEIVRQIEQYWFAVVTLPPKE